MLLLGLEMSIASVLASVAVILILRSGLQLWQLKSKARGPVACFYAPLLIRPFRLMSELIPNIRHINVGLMDQIWPSKFDLFQEAGSSVLVFSGLLPTPGLQGIVGDADAARALFNNKLAWGKPIQDYSVLTFFGDNIITTEKEQWRRHRRLTSPSFSEKNNAAVWRDTQGIMKEWFGTLSAHDDGEGSALDDDTVATTLRLTLMIISAAAFGQRFPWPSARKTSDVPPPGRKLAFITALQGVVDGTLAKLILPKFAYRLPLKYPQRVQLCFSELEAHLHGMIEERKDEKAGGVERTDLFSALLEGVADDEGAAVLTTEELVADMWIFLLAGHETTAHTLAFLLTLLALYPEHQQILHEEASELGEHSTYDDFSSFPYALATMQEALRLYTPVQLIPKVALEDAVLPAHTTPSSPDEEPRPTEIFVPKGTRVGVLSSAIHYNPAYWREPFEFRPSRFIDNEEGKWNRDAFVAFSGGARGCLGQRFALVESVAMISQLLLHYTIHVPENLQDDYARQEGESERDRRERIFKPKGGLTLTPSSKLPLVFKKRASS
ncbi:cytochrome P450 [Leucosporidium creatinivorum]|uniref:Cytochrome P450 n=1 Tax=Leucosporidium creatinivorum TaxID=106004 RepID=A0A1Y2ET62_9BASI|nr:cytochrome P450 [Leucosporidium creatinivorum]